MVDSIYVQLWVMSLNNHDDANNIHLLIHIDFFLSDVHTF